MNRRALFSVVPAVAFAGLAGLFYLGLSGDPTRLPSALINKPAPVFALKGIDGAPWPGFSTADLAKGRVTVVNIFASWCAPCREEHPLLVKLAQRPDIVLVGIDNKDDAGDAIRFLNTLGNPYAMIGADTDGRVTIDWGGYGVPETFVVDGKGVIRHKIVGPLSEEIIKESLNPAIAAAQRTPE